MKPETNPKTQSPAEGKEIINTIGYGAYSEVKAVTAENVEKFIRNIHFTDGKQNLMIQIFPNYPEIRVTDQNGEEDIEKTKQRRQEFDDISGYKAMKITMSDILERGASVKSIGITYRGGAYSLDEIRNLPAASFSAYPGRGAVVNELLPGIVVNDEGETEVYQFDVTRGIRTQLHNFRIIKQDETPEPSGRAYCLPLYPVVAQVDFGNEAAIQQVQRVGAPTIMPKAVDDISETDYAELKKWFKRFGSAWGKNTAFLIPPGTEFPNLQIREGSVARDYIDTRVKWIQTFFNPVTDLQNSGTTIGASDSGRLEIWANHITSLQKLSAGWLEDIFDELDRWNGYEGYHTEIKLKEPSVDKSALVLQSIQGLAAVKGISVEEARDNLKGVLRLKDFTPDLELQLKEQYPASSVAGLFGNTAEPTPGFTTPEDQIMSKTEKQINLANTTTQKAIDKIMGYPEESEDAE